MRNIRLVVVFAIVYVDMLGVGIAYPVLPRLLQQFQHGSIVQASYLFGLLGSAYALTQFLFAPLFGALSDCFGRRPVMLLALAGSAVLYLMTAFAPGIAMLALARLLAGVMGGSFTSAGAYLADITPPEKRAQSFGLIGAAFGFGLITGPVVGGLLGDIDLHLPFLVAGILCAVNVGFGFFALPESLAPQNRRPFHIAEANPVGAILEIGRYAAIYRLLIVFLIATFANRVGEMVWPLYTAYRFHWSSFQIGLSLAAAGVIFVTGQGWFTRILLPRIGERRAILTGLGVSVLVAIGYGMVTKGWMLYAVMPFAISGWTVAQPAVQGLMSRAVPADQQGLLQGAMASITNLTSIGGPVVWSSLFGYFVSPAAPAIVPGAAFFVSALLFLVALVLAVRWEGATLAEPAVAERSSRLHEVPIA
ncbi:MAG TPA: TCR/Tet family MFS transporter [Rhizomicrobium sp.]|nr:TCR/Tet family MFS transporter [Rhizomicrobium sp.]